MTSVCRAKAGPERAVVREENGKPAQLGKNKENDSILWVTVIRHKENERLKKKKNISRKSTYAALPFPRDRDL